MSLTMKGWGTTRLDVKDLDRNIIKIYIIGYRDDPNPDFDRTPVNHWDTLFELGANAQSDTPKSYVSMDMNAGNGADGLTGYLVLFSRPEFEAAGSVKTHAITLKSLDTTLSTALEIIKSKGRDRFRFTQNGQGCASWIWTFVKDLEEAGIVEGGSPAEAWAVMTKYWAYPPGSGFREREAEIGTFF